MNPTLPEKRYELIDLEPVFVAAQTQTDAVLVGGQAVYFWADQYRASCPALNEYLPFTSKDADYLADIATAEQLAQSLDSRFQPASRKGGMMGLCLGYIPVSGGLKL